MRNRDIVFSKEELYSRVWGLDSYGDYATVAVHINRLREEIEIIHPIVSILLQCGV